MTPVDGTLTRSAARRTRGRLAITGALVALGLAAVLIGPEPTETPLDPASAGADGLLGLIEVLTAAGVQIDVSLDLPNDMSTTAFVPVDRLGARREAWLGWVGDGGRLVVADPGSELHGLPAAAGGFVDAIGPTSRAPGCDALGSVGAVTHAEWHQFAIPEDAVSVCFRTGAEHAWLVERGHGQGSIVALGSAAPFTNRLLDSDDHVILAAALLAPAPGDRLQVVPRGPVGAGETSLPDLVPTRVWHGLATLGIAVVVGAIASGRRFGRPVPEILPPVLPGSELATSLAQLLQSAGRPGAAAQRLREDARALVARAAGMGPGTDPGRLVAVAVERLGIERPLAETALTDSPVRGEAELLAVQQAVRTVRARATGAQA